jgi:hypothetical protein
MATVPGRGTLERRAGAHEHGLAEMSGDELERDRQSVGRCTTR